MNNLYQLNNKEYSHITLDNGLVIGEGYFTVIWFSVPAGSP